MRTFFQKFYKFRSEKQCPSLSSTQKNNSRQNNIMNPLTQSSRPPQGQAQGDQSNNFIGAPSTTISISSSPQSMLAQQQHMMNLMSANPALAAAVAAAVPLFPAAALHSNPGSYLAMQTNKPETDFVGMAAQVATASQPQPHHPRHSASLHSNVDPMQPRTVIAIAPSSQQQSATLFFSAPCVGASMNSAGASFTAGDDKGSEGFVSEERAKLIRDRNREHARCTRIRKKASVQKLKELVERLHAERTVEMRQMSASAKQLAEQQTVRRDVLRTFFRYHSTYETDMRKWSMIVEDGFWLKQPVTPYRFFRRGEMEKGSRISRGVEAVIEDAASLSVMIESIGCRTSRWRQMTRYEFISLETSKRGPENLPCCTKRQKSRLQHAISSLSSSSDSSNPASSIVTRDNDDSSPGRVEKVQTPNEGAMIGPETETNRSFTDVQSKHVQNIIASIGGSVVSSGNAVGSSENKSKRRDATEFFHDYHAKPLPDPKISDFDRSNESSPSEDDPADDPNRSSMADRKRPIGSDLLMGCDYEPTEPRAVKRRKTDSVSNECPSQRLKVMFSQGTTTSIYPNIARMGGIRHSIGSSHSAVEAPPVLTGVGKRHGSVPSAAGSSSLLTGAGALRERSTTLAADFCSQHDSNDNTNVAVDAASNPCHIDLDTNSSGNEVSRGPQIRARYHLNEDDMIMMGGVLMGPFVFRSQDAVLRGAVSECAMPGMVRAYFSAQNKLQSLEMLYDALGFMQQLERANGHESVPHIIPGCLEMALAPNCNEARVITLANPPYLIVNVNEVWTRTTGYTQNDVEGIAYLTLLEGESTVLETKAKHRKPIHLLEEVAQGRPACSTNIHYDRDGRDFIEFICSFPLTNNDDEVTHILHVSQELPSFRE